LYRRYKDQVEFKLVYVREAHPDDGRQTEANRRAGVVYKAPTNDAERASIAFACVRSLGITFPCLVDNMQDTAQRAFRAWPARAVVIGSDGRIAYLSAPGPQGVKAAEIQTALEGILPSGRPSAPGFP
jgi:type I thyroxine 5'-deiodinase